MLRKLQQLREKEKGFTIIEVLIVLAIGALIIVIVLVAIPQLQKNQRNTARKSILARISTEVGNYAGNNNGNLPNGSSIGTVDGNFGRTTADANNTLFKRYLSNVDLKDPKTGNDMVVYVAGAPAADFVQDVAPATVISYPDSEGEFGYYESAKCSGENVADSTNNRDYAVVVWLEGGARYCLGSS